MRKGKLRKGDMILTTRGSVGNIALNIDSIQFDNMRINSGMVIIRKNFISLDMAFLYKIFQSNVIRAQIYRTVFGSAQPQLTVKEINRFKVSLPSKDEQIQMVKFLDTYFKYVELCQDQLAKLMSFKQGLLQKMLI